MQKVLVMNAGSSSLKFQVMEGDVVLAKGLCERIGLTEPVLNYARGSEAAQRFVKDMPDHFSAIELVFSFLTSEAHGVLNSMDEIAAVGHRVPHGGEDFDRSVLIDENVMALIRRNAVLAPLHSPPIIQGIEAAQALMPTTPMVAVFDTAFHQTMPEKAFLYALPYEDYTELQIRRYGFHGTSHKYVAQRAAALMNKPVETLKLITCHLGNGSSIAAIAGGKSVDTSMGFTPLEGIPMGTRSGSFDPAIVMYLMEKRNMNLDEVNAYLQKKSGVLGLSGVSSDFRDLHHAASEGNARAKAALEVFAYAVRKYIGAYAAAMEGVDALVFTGGIGENDAKTRALCADGLSFMGLTLCNEKNANAPRGQEVCISKGASQAEIFVIPTNEEWMIARDALALAQKA
ncbi:acetate kinase [Christensenellaceae bacterium OttesenSCG-928-L17]|nr:acetate kinase [Christensenellaceae bacterium OttesenSCG-928-L17]